MEGDGVRKYKDARSIRIKQRLEAAAFYIGNECLFSQGMEVNPLLESISSTVSALDLLPEPLSISSNHHLKPSAPAVILDAMPCSSDCNPYCSYGQLPPISCNDRVAHRNRTAWNYLERSEAWGFVGLPPYKEKDNIRLTIHQQSSGK